MKQQFVRGPGNIGLHLIPKKLLESRLSFYTIMQLPKEKFSLFFLVGTVQKTSFIVSSCTFTLKKVKVQELTMKEVFCTIPSGKNKEKHFFG